MIEKVLLKFNEVEHVLIEKVEQLSGHALSSTLRFFFRLLETPAQKNAASAIMCTAFSMGAAVRPKGPNGAHRSFPSDQ